MKATLLDRRDDGASGVCYLCKVSLTDYIESLPASYKEYEIQREIVSNSYLDHLVDTVLARRHIPAIVLVADNVDVLSANDTLEVAQFKIIDGLQRTFRLQAISKTIAYCLRHLSSVRESSSKSRFAFSKNFSADLQKFDSNTALLRSVFDFHESKGADALRDCLSGNFQWFEIWTGLSPDEEVRKMLTLNAGHKPVKTRHQLELLFLYLLPTLKSKDALAFKLMREKQVSATQFSKTRGIGEFHFAHVITALLSFARAKPIAPSTNLIQQLQDDSDDFGENAEIARPGFLEAAVEFLVKVDRTVHQEYGDIGALWLGREVVLAGMFAALGSYSTSESTSAQAAFDKFLSVLHANPGILALAGFESARNSLELSKVNIGAANRSAIFAALSDVLYERTKMLAWPRYFGAAL